MKTLIFLLVFLPSICFGQFSLTSSIGYGINVNSKGDYTLFQSSVTITPQWTIDKIVIGAVSNAVVTDSTTTLFNGIQLSYPVWIEKEKSITIAGHSLLGFEGDMLNGGSISYNVGDVGLDAVLSQEYNRKEFWGVLNLRYTIIK